jgi:hypothetical protein
MDLPLCTHRYMIQVARDNVTHFADFLYQHAIHMKSVPQIQHAPAPLLMHPGNLQVKLSYV